MFIALLIVHILVSISLVLVVLVQTGRGAELGAAFGGMGQTTFGRGQSTFITKFTTSLAVVFMLTSLSLAFISSERPTQSVISPEATAPAARTSAPAPSAAQPVPAEQAPDAPQTAAPLEQTKAPPIANPQPPEKQ